VFAPRPRERQEEGGRDRRDEHQRDLEVVAVERGERERHDREEAGDVRRPHAPHQLVELGQAHDPEEAHAERPHEPAVAHDDRGEDDRRDRGQDARAEVRPLVSAARRHQRAP
jgi:hypothetical protein